MKLVAKWVLIVLMIGPLMASIAACGPPTANISQHKYTLQGTFSASGFPNVTIQLTPILPPKALSTLPSDWVQVNVTVGDFSFSTDDPAFKCFEGVAPFLFTSEVDYPGLFIAAYNNCYTGDTKHAGVAMVTHLPLDDQCQTNCYAMFTFPKNDPSLCQTSSDGSTACFPATQPSAPPTPTPAPQPTACGQGNSTDPAAIITNPQTTTGLDANSNPTNPTTTFQINQPIYLTVNLQPPEGGGYAFAKWYLNNSVYQVGDILPVDACWTHAASAPVTYTQVGQGLVEAYWCTQSNCGDAQLATSVQFTVTGQ